MIRVAGAVAILLCLAAAAYSLSRLAAPPAAPTVEEVDAALNAGEIDKAIELLERMVEHEPENRDVRYLLAVAEGMGGRPFRALELFQGLPGFADDASLNLMAGQLALQAHRLSAAVNFLERSLELSPLDPDACRLLANLYANLCDPNQSRAYLAALDAVGQITAEDVMLFCVGDRARYDLYENVDQLQQALAQSPHDGQVIHALFDAYLAMDKVDKAWELLQNHQAMDANESEWWIDLANAEMLSTRDEPESAATLLDQLPSQADRLPRTWLMRGRVCRALNQTQRALAAFRNAARLDPFDPEPEFLISRILESADSAASDKAQDRARSLQALNVQVESVVSLEKIEDVVERLPKVAQQLADLGFTREAVLCLQWMEAKGYRFRTVQDLRENLLRDSPLSRSTLVVPPSSGLEALPAAETTTPPSESILGPAGQPIIAFDNVTQRMLLKFEYQLPDDGKYRVLTSVGGGCGALDFDRDGFVDLFFPQGGPLPNQVDRNTDEDKLVRHSGGKFVDVSVLAGIRASSYGHGVAVGDIDGDGFPEIFVSNYGADELYRNNGDGTFQNITAEAGLETNDWSTSAAFADLSGDGLPDLYVVNYLTAAVAEMNPYVDEDNTPSGPLSYPAQQDRLYLNLGDGRFQDMTAQADITFPEGKGLGVVIGDFDRKGLVDVFVANDRSPNSMFLNQSSNGLMKLTEAGLVAGVAYGGDGNAEACMGIACGDIDENGFLDLFVTNFKGETNTFYLNSGNAEFSDRTDAYGLGSISFNMMGWGTHFLDVDPDGLLDLVLLNGHLHQQPMHAQLFLGRGDHFDDLTAQAGDYFQIETLGRGLAWADLNRDHQADLIATYLHGPPTLLESRSARGRRLSLSFVGRVSSRDAIGASVTITSGDRRITRDLIGGGGYLCANEQKLFIACGAADATVDRLHIRWPSGREDEWDEVPQSSGLILVESTDDSPGLIIPAP